ncbi:hypothetical protein C8R46DRAFT_1288968 [Mycena filopes]|nr:hypothetical protein C8R46DRAFT_1288968 [Mycena filopes]
MSQFTNNNIERTDYAAGGQQLPPGAGMPNNNNNTYGMGAEPGMGGSHNTTTTHGMGESGMGGANPAMVGGGRHHVPAGGLNDGGMPMPASTYQQENQHQHQPLASHANANAAGAIPPSDHVNPNLGPTNHSTGGGKVTGKIEHVIGSIVGSKSLKAKGIQKEQAAHGFKVQGEELAEAERLEQEAGMRRERAVAHGAHPENRHVGGMGAPGGVGGMGAGGVGDMGSGTGGVGGMVVVTQQPPTARAIAKRTDGPLSATR